LALGADANYRYHYPGWPLPNERSFTTPLFEAKSPDMARWLLSHGADPYLEREILHEWFGTDWHYDSTGKSESFLTVRHVPAMAAFVKSLPLAPRHRREGPA